MAKRQSGFLDLSQKMNCADPIFLPRRSKQNLPKYIGGKWKLPNNGAGLSE
jgi:hypothetical protein